MNKVQRARFGRWLHDARVQASKTQEQVGKDADLTRQYIGKIENGKAGLKRDTVERLASVVGRPVDEALINAGFQGSDVTHTSPFLTDDPLIELLGSLSAKDKDVLKLLAERLHSNSQETRVSLIPEIKAGEEILILDRQKGYLYDSNHENMGRDYVLTLITLLAKRLDADSDQYSTDSVDAVVTTPLLT